MRQRLRIQRSAREDLHAIWAWINAHDPRAAENAVRRISGVFQLLAENPRLGRVRPDLSDGLRSFPADQHIIYYRIEGRAVSIRRVLSAVRDVRPRDIDYLQRKKRAGARLSKR